MDVDLPKAPGDRNGLLRCTEPAARGTQVEGGRGSGLSPFFDLQAMAWPAPRQLLDDQKLLGLSKVRIESYLGLVSTLLPAALEACRG